VRAGLGFALVENVGYILMQPTLTGQIEVWMLRAFLAVPGHAMWTGMIGALAAQRRFDKRGLGPRRRLPARGRVPRRLRVSVFAREPLRLEGYDTLSKALAAVPILMTVLASSCFAGLARHALQLDDRDAAVRAARALSSSAHDAATTALPSARPAI